MQILDPTHPFFKPLWRRVAIVAVTLGWAGFEFSTTSVLWGMLFGALGVYCLLQLIVFYDPAASRDETDSEDGT